jgi:hypothetical protein
MADDPIAPIVEKTGLLASVDWIKAGQVLGVPALGMLILMAIGYKFVSNQATQAANDSETRQELLKELVAAQIDQGKMTATTLVRMGDSVKHMEQLADSSVNNDKLVIETQGRIADSIADLRKITEQSVINSKALVGAQGKVSDAIDRMAPPRPSPAKGAETKRGP